MDQANRLFAKQQMLQGKDVGDYWQHMLPERVCASRTGLCPQSPIEEISAPWQPLGLLLLFSRPSSHERLPSQERPTVIFNARWTKSSKDVIHTHGICTTPSSPSLTSIRTCRRIRSSVQHSISSGTLQIVKQMSILESCLMMSDDDR